jgi:hypothetical protein
MTPPRLTLEVVAVTGGYAVGTVVGDRDGHYWPAPVAIRVRPDVAAAILADLGDPAGMPPVLVADPHHLDRPRPLHRLRYAAWYRVGLPALGMLVRVLPLHVAAALADRYDRLELHYGGYRMLPDALAGIGCDRYDQVTDAGCAVRFAVARRARRALHRSDRYRAVADPIRREVRR